MSKSISEILLNIGAVKINTDEKFTWASGIKSPIYCDNRKTIGFPEKRAQIVEAFVASIKENFSDVEVIAGTATAEFRMLLLLRKKWHCQWYMCAVKKRHTVLVSRLKDAKLTAKRL